MTEVLLSLVTAASLLVALVAWRQARRATQQLEQLTQMYWELKYQHGELRLRVQGDRVSTPSSEEAPAQVTTGDTAFIPLTAVKR